MQVPYRDPETRKNHGVVLVQYSLGAHALESWSPLGVSRRCMWVIIALISYREYCPGAEMTSMQSSRRYV